jgi:hypothetical protein
MENKRPMPATTLSTPTYPPLLPIGRDRHARGTVNEYLGGASRTKIHYLTKAGHLATVRIGRRVLITRASADALIAAGGCA